jgi:adenylate cyclase, class 2
LNGYDNTELCACPDFSASFHFFMSHEIEVKLKLDVAALERAGIRLEVVLPRHFEENWLLDTVLRQLGEKFSILRVRAVNGSGFLTLKERPGSDAPASQFKLRIEIETEIGDPEKALEIFERLGFKKWFGYQKYRTVYRAILPDGNELQVMADETPVGNFLELEGEEDTILAAVKLLGLNPTDYLLDSYLALQIAHCQQQGKSLEDMVF